MSKRNDYLRIRYARIWIAGSTGRRVHPIYPAKRHALADYKFERECRDIALPSRLPF